MHYNAHDGMAFGDTTNTNTGCNYLEIDHNMMSGHYYPFKLYHSTYCTIEFNNREQGRLRVEDRVSSARTTCSSTTGW